MTSEPGPGFWAIFGMILGALGGLAGIVALLRLLFFRKKEGRKLDADAGLVEIQAKSQETTTSFGMAKELLDRQNARIVQLENRLDAIEARLQKEQEERAAAVLLAASFQAKAKRVDELEAEAEELRARITILEDGDLSWSRENARLTAEVLALRQELSRRTS